MRDSCQQPIICQSLAVALKTGFRPGLGGFHGKKGNGRGGYREGLPFRGEGFRRGVDQTGPLKEVFLREAVAEASLRIPDMRRSLPRGLYFADETGREAHMAKFARLAAEIAGKASFDELYRPSRANSYAGRGLLCVEP